MILGTLQYPSRYGGLGHGVKDGLAWLANADIHSLSLGRHEIDGDNIYFDVMELTTIPSAQALFEAHRRYLDIHITLSGEEWFGHAPIASLKEAEPYSEEKDRALYSGEGVYLRAPEGHFVLFMPDDAHKPKICFGEPGKIRKIVLKVKIV